jgi:hypothetical protein
MLTIPTHYSYHPSCIPPPEWHPTASWTRPTSAPSISIWNAWHNAIAMWVGFIYTELASGLLSCRFLRDTQIIPERKRAWHLDYAMKALEHAEAAMWKLKLSHPEFDQMMALAERLRFEVDSFKRL